MDTVSGEGAYLVWIGLPITRDPDQSARFDMINAIVQQEARKRPGRVAYVDTYTRFAGDDGGFAEYLPNAAGRLVKRTRTRRRPLRARRRRDHRPRGAPAPERGLRPDELAQAAFRLAGC